MKKCLLMHRRNSKTTQKKVKIFISLCILFFLIFLTPISSVAHSETVDTQVDKEAEQALDESILAQLDKLDLRALEKYLEELNGFGSSSVKERLLEYIRGANIDYSQFWQGLGQVFFEKINEILPSFACITAIALLSGIIATLKSGTAGQTSSEMIFLLTYASALIPLFGILIQCFSSASKSINEMRRQMQIVYPLLLTLMSVCGGSVSASVCRPAVAFFGTTIVSVIDKIVFPLTITMILLSVAGNLTKELKIGKFSAFFKSINKWLIGICVSVFGIFFTLQGITTATYDGIARRTVKYAIGNGIPIVGGFLSGGFDLAVAGSVLIKNSLGSMSIFLMFSVLFEPIVLLVCVNVLLRLVSAISQPFGDGRISDFLGETAENLHYCTAGLLFTAFLYFLSIVLMIYSTEALF